MGAALFSHPTLTAGGPSSTIYFVSTSKAAGGRPKHVAVYEAGKDAQVRFAVGMQAIMASRLHGKPATRRQGKPSKG